MSKFPTLWFWQKSRLTAEWFEVYSYETDERPKPSLTRSPTLPTSAAPWSSSTVDLVGRLRISVPKEHIPDAPPMWYLLVRQYHATPLSQTLVGFTTPDYPDGTVIEVGEFQNTGLELSQRACAINWGFGDPHIYQIYVAEEHRRKRMSVKLINVADVVNVAGNWGGFIYGGDQVTAMGAELGKAWTNSVRLKPVEVVLPPMD